jgi:hypothetical protein
MVRHKGSSNRECQIRKKPPDRFSGFGPVGFTCTLLARPAGAAAVRLALAKTGDQR